MEFYGCILFSRVLIVWFSFMLLNGFFRMVLVLVVVRSSVLEGEMKVFLLDIVKMWYLLVGSCFNFLIRFNLFIFGISMFVIIRFGVFCWIIFMVIWLFFVLEIVCFWCFKLVVMDFWMLGMLLIMRILVMIVGFLCCFYLIGSGYSGCDG